MALKTFNVDEKMYERYSKHCKKEGISMSKQVDKFIQEELMKLEKSVSKIPAAERTLSSEHSMKKYC